VGLRDWLWTRLPIPAPNFELKIAECRALSNLTEDQILYWLATNPYTATELVEMLKQSDRVADEIRRSWARRT
jgi:hypothetical protein